MPKLKYQSSGAGPIGRECGWPKRYCDRSLNARYTSTAFGHPRRHRGDRMLHRGARADAPARRARPPVDLLDAEVAHELELVVAVDGERDQAVDVGGREAGVEDRRAARFGRELHRAAAGVLGELGGADPGDQRAGHDATRKNGRARAPVVAELHDHRQVVVRTTVRRVDEVRHEPRALLQLHQDHDAGLVVRVGSGGASTSTRRCGRARSPRRCPTSNEPQTPHIGAGGWRSAPQSAQRWISRRPSAAPSQKKASSGCRSTGVAHRLALIGMI